MMLTTGELKQAAEYAKRSLKYETFASKRFSTYMTYDLFISHSFKDKDLVVGLYYMFDRAGYNVYIDWIDDASLNRENVTDQTAAIIRQRIKQSKAKDCHILRRQILPHQSGVLGNLGFLMACMVKHVFYQL